MLILAQSAFLFQLQKQKDQEVERLTEVSFPNRYYTRY